MKELPIEEKLDIIRENDQVIPYNELISHHDETLIITEGNDEVGVYIILEDISELISSEEMLDDINDLKEEEKTIDIKDFESKTHDINIIFDDDKELGIYIPIDDIANWIN